MNFYSDIFNPQDLTSTNYPSETHHEHQFYNSNRYGRYETKYYNYSIERTANGPFTLKLVDSTCSYLRLKVSDASESGKVFINNEHWGDSYKTKMIEIDSKSIQIQIHFSSSYSSYNNCCWKMEYEDEELNQAVDFCK